MTVDEIKRTYSMREIVERYGFHTNRSGFISCPFHTGDNSPSMKIYQKDFHCHACGANGDIFTFIQRMDNCDFKTAFYSLGGTYEKPTTASKMAVYHMKKEKEKREKKKLELKTKQKENDKWLGFYIVLLKHLKPYSDLWCYCIDQYTKCIAIDEFIQKEKERGL